MLAIDLLRALLMLLLPPVVYMLPGPAARGFAAAFGGGGGAAPLRRAADADALPQMGTQGSSQATKKAKAAAVACFNKFLLTTNGLVPVRAFTECFFASLSTVHPILSPHLPTRQRPPTFDDCDSDVMCNEVIYLEFAHYLAHEASKKSSGESLKVGTVVEYLRKTINSAEDKFGKDHPAFFAVLEKSDKPNWLKGAIRQIQALMFHESLSRGEAPATQAQGIYLVHRRDLSRQWRVHGSGESLRRALVINLNGVAAGRPGEIVTLSPDVLLWDARFVCGYVSWPQVKSLKYKTVMFAAGNDRFICVLNSFACAFSAGCFGAHTYDYEGMNYFFPDLAESSAASTTIGGWIKAMSPSSNNVTYLDYHVASLPEDPTAAGERVGSINVMAAGGVCSEFALAVSGHDAEKLSTLWHYICLSLAAMVPGANVLGGWTAPPYGQLGEGAKPAS